MDNVDDLVFSFLNEKPGLGKAIGKQIFSILTYSINDYRKGHCRTDSFYTFNEGAETTGYDVRCIDSPLDLSISTNRGMHLTQVLIT